MHKQQRGTSMFKTVSKMAVILLGIVLSSSLAFSKTLTKEQKLLDFQYLISHVKSSYGPLEYKTNMSIVNIDKLIKKFKTKITKTKTNGEYYYIIKEFVASFRDGHFSASIPTAERAVLPIITEWVDGHVLIQASRPIAGNVQLSPGDEILKVDNQSVKSVMKGLKKYIGSGSKQTETRWAAWLIAIRPGSFLPVPSGDVTLTVKLKSSAKIVDVKLKWVVTGESLDEKDKFLLPSNHFQNFFSNKKTTFNPIDNLSVAEKIEPLGEAFAEVTYLCSAETRIALPAAATIIMKKPFVAYYYTTARGNVGYLRLPHYSFGPQSESVLDNYIYAISVLEKNTVALVIDQDHNCGGSVSFLGQIAGLFIKKPVENALFKLVANKAMYISLKKNIEQSNPNVLGFAIWKHFLNEVKQAWLAGDHLTPKISFQKIYPNQEANYTKPIVVLTDELAGSGGDAFPALMQGYDRATIIGTQTSGLGGSVASIPNLPFSQISVRLTQTLFYHPNGQAIENNGVKPDIPYTITAEDFLGGYSQYRKFYTEKVLDIL